MKRYISILIALVISLPLFSQIGGSSGIGGNTSDVTGDFEGACISDGIDTFSGYVQKIGKSVAFYDLNFEVVDGATAIDPSLCEYRPSDCVESQEWTYALDNTGTSFAEDNTIKVTLSDGTSFTFNQPPAAGWTPQMQVWGDEIQSAADASGLAWFVETRFIAGSGSLTGGGGFSGPPSVPVSVALYEGGMRWRYVNIQICPGQPTPVGAEIVDSSNPARIGFNLTSAGPVKGPIQKFFVCRDCGKEPVWYLEDGVNPANSGQIPNCYEPCGTLSGLPAPPENDCTYEIDVACDNNNSINTIDFTNTITRRATVCNGEQIAVDYFQADPTDANALITYTLVGDFVDCATGEPVALPDPDIILEEIAKVEICDGLNTLWQVSTIDTDGTITITYEDQTGTVTEPNSWVVGGCACTAIDYFEIEGITTGLRNREWHDSQPAIPTTNTTTEDGRNFRLSHDFSLPTTTDNVQTNLGLNDTNNTVAELDVQVKEGYVIVSETTNLRYLGNSEGYWAVEIGQCCSSELQLLAENGGFFNGRQMTFTLPKGIHYIRLWNIDSAGSNSDATMGYSIDGGITWINDNAPPNISISTTKPSQVCKQGYLCNAEYFQLDKSNPIVFDESILKCELECATSESKVITVSVSEVEVCADGSAAFQKTVIDSDGVETISYYNNTGVITPTNVIAGSCTKTSECVKWRNKYVGIDNDGTTFNATYLIEVRDDQGDVVGTFTQGLSANNTTQLNEWIVGLQALYPNALIEQRYHPSANAGLPGPTTGTVWTQMDARYVQFTACDGDPLPATITIIENNGNPASQAMDVEVFFGEEVRGYVCYECGIAPTVFYTDGSEVDLADIPPCYVTCAEGFEEEESAAIVNIDNEALAKAILDEERGRTEGGVFYVINNINTVDLGLPSGTMGCLTGVTESGTGLVYWTNDGTTPSITNGGVFNNNYGNSQRICGIDLSLLRFKGSSTGSDYTVTYEIWKP